MPSVNNHPVDIHHPGLEGKAALIGGKDLLFSGHPGGYWLRPAPGVLGLDWDPVKIYSCDPYMFNEFLSVDGWELVNRICCRTIYSAAVVLFR